MLLYLLKSKYVDLNIVNILIYWILQDLYSIGEWSLYLCLVLMWDIAQIMKSKLKFELIVKLTSCFIRILKILIYQLNSLKVKTIIKGKFFFLSYSYNHICIILEYTILLNYCLYFRCNILKRLKKLINKNNKNMANFDSIKLSHTHTHTHTHRSVKDCLRP